MPRSLHRVFLAFHAILGAVVLIESIRTALHALGGRANHHLFLLATVEAIGAALFLVPRTLLVGAGAMLLTFAIAFLVHAARGEFNLGLLVYAAGTILVAARHRAVATEAARA
jgi:hypothetical protein